MSELSKKELNIIADHIESLDLWGKTSGRHWTLECLVDFESIIQFSSSFQEPVLELVASRVADGELKGNDFEVMISGDSILRGDSSVLGLDADDEDINVTVDYRLRYDIVDDTELWGIIQDVVDTHWKFSKLTQYLKDKISLFIKNAFDKEVLGYGRLDKTKEDVKQLIDDNLFFINVVDSKNKDYGKFLDAYEDGERSYGHALIIACDTVDGETVIITGELI